MESRGESKKSFRPGYICVDGNLLHANRIALDLSIHAAAKIIGYEASNYKSLEDGRIKSMSPESSERASFLLEPMIEDFLVDENGVSQLQSSVSVYLLRP